MKIIGLGHRKFVGKDTCFQFFQDAIRVLNESNERLKYPITSRVAFADILKDICRLMYSEQIRANWHYEENTADKNNPVTLYDGNTRSVRDIWIEVGNKLREVDQNIWIGAALSKASAQGCKCVIITDVRYPNEANFIKQKGGLLFKVQNSRVAKTDDVADCALELFGDWDETIFNEGSLKELEQKCKHLVQKHKNYLTIL